MGDIAFDPGPDRIDDQGPESADSKLTRRLQAIAAGHAAEAARQVAEERARRLLWLSHHWPEQYEERCVMIGSWPVCRRCGALYPLGFAIAFASALGLALWPDRWDPAAIWLLCLPATFAFIGEMLGWFRYSVRWQVTSTVVAALAFGKALGYELGERWSPEFWGPIAVFGGLWFFASLFGHRRRARSDEAVQ